MVAATPGKNLGPQMPKWSNDSYLHENQEPETTCTFSMTCLIDVVISNLFLHLIEITRFQNHMMAHLQTCRCRGKIYFHVKNNFVYTIVMYS